MSKLIEQVFDYAIATAEDKGEYAKLIDMKRVCEILRATEFPGKRKAIISALEEHYAIGLPKDAIGDRRVIPFPSKRPLSL